MKIGCCIDISQYDTLVANGYDSIALAAKDVADWDEATLCAVEKKLKEGPLATISLNSFCTDALQLKGKSFDLQTVCDYTERVCSRGKRLGFRCIGIGAPKSRNLQPGDDAELCREQFLLALVGMCRVAEKYDMDILMESVCSLECNFVTTTSEALEILRELKLKNLHLVYDIYHEYMENQPLSVIREAGDEIRVVHIAQDLGGKRAYLDEEHMADYRRYWDALTEIGYTGEWNLESFVGDVAQELPRSMAIMRQIKEG